MGSGACVEACVGWEVESVVEGLALRGLDLLGLEGEGGGAMVYFVVMRVYGFVG
jgi:hypothetical protein